jgi:GT2 family glycosyltransferase
MALPEVIVPVHDAYDYARGCLAALSAASPEAQVLLIDDASTDARVLPALEAWVADSPLRRLLRQADNRGFVHTANLGIANTTRDIVLLNSDTEVTAGWLEALGRCLDADPAIATATPWTNNGEIASLPEFCARNPVPPDRDAVARSLQARVRPAYPEIPTAVGFCMAISRRAIEHVGVFDEEAFGHGYGEENDFCMRAAAAGMRNVLCDDAYVVHHGGRSFGPLGRQPDADAMERLLALHPGYERLVARFIREDPLAPARREALRALRRDGVSMG